MFWTSIVLGNTDPTDKKLLHGTITDKISGEPLIGVNVYLPELKKGTVTGVDGKYHISNLPENKTTIQVTYIGHQSIIKIVDLSSNEAQNFVMDESNARIDEIVITALTGNALVGRTPSPISLVSKSELLQQSSTNIIDAISKQPGISQITTGSSISKPVIRGLGFNRVVVVNDGVRQEGQQWGDEHGIEIDGQSINSVEILKGPASLSYGSDAMAGVINFMPAPFLPEGRINTNLYSEYQTNNGLLNFSVNNAGNKNGIIWNWRYSDKRAHSYKNKYDGYVFNSGFQERALTGLLGLNKSWGYSNLTLSYYKITPGIVTGDRDEETGKFIKHENIDGKEIEALATKKDGKSYKHFTPYQQIYHYKAVLNNNVIVGQGNIKSSIAYQLNKRQEFENVLTPNDPDLYFQLHTWNYDIRYSLPDLMGYKITGGINGMFQRSLNKGSEILLPEYDVFDFGLFGIISKNFGRLDLSGGLRYDYRHQNVKAFEPHIHDHHSLSSIIEQEEEHESKLQPGFTKNYNGISASLGLAYQLSDNWHAKLNASRGFRTPNISELSSNGSHGSAMRYEIGNPDLKSENSWQIDLGMGYSSNLISVEIALFANRINNYIFSTKLLNEDGTDLINHGLKTYQFSSGNARIMGGEISVDFHPIQRIHFLNTYSIVNSIQLNQPKDSKYLPFTPAPKWSSDLRFDLIRHGKKLNNMYASIGIDHNFKQDKVYSVNNTETPTQAYTLLNVGFGTDLLYKGNTLASIYITANNITNKAYQNHLSRLKYLDEDSTSGRQGIFNMGRNLGIKVIIPINL